MQVIFLPSGSGPSRNFRFRFMLVCIIAAGVFLAVGSGTAYLGYRLGSVPAQTDPHAEYGARAPAAAAKRSGQSVPPGVMVHPPRTAITIVRRPAEPPVVSTEQLSVLQASVDEQRERLRESRRRLSDHIDSLGQRLGQIQAHVSRLNALGQRLADMAGLDRDEFSFDALPAVGGPERPIPWDRKPEPDLGETLHVIEIALQKKENELRVLEALLTDRELHQKQYPRGWPTSSGGWVSSSYGSRTDPFSGRKAFHEGVDIAVRSGSEIRAMAAGVVSFAGEKPGYGMVIEINHGNGYETRYAHAKELIAKVGDRVDKGDPVALVGSTGRSTGSHVHIEVLENGIAINPHDHLNASG